MKADQVSRQADGLKFIIYPLFDMGRTVFRVAAQVSAFVLAGLALKIWFFPPAAPALFIYAGAVFAIRLTVIAIDYSQKNALDTIKNSATNWRKENPSTIWIALGIAAVLHPISRVVSTLLAVGAGAGTGILLGRDVSGPPDLSTRSWIKMFLPQ